MHTRHWPGVKWEAMHPLMFGCDCRETHHCHFCSPQCHHNSSGGVSSFHLCFIPFHHITRIDRSVSPPDPPSPHLILPCLTVPVPATATATATYCSSSRWSLGGQWPWRTAWQPQSSPIKTTAVTATAATTVTAATHNPVAPTLLAASPSRRMTASPSSACRAWETCGRATASSHRCWWTR